MSECEGCIYFWDNFDEPWCHKDIKAGVCKITGTTKIPEDKLENIIRCLHQIFRPERPMEPMIEGMGDCYHCIPDKFNRQCVGYVPVSLSVVMIYDKTK